uniref:EF-hand domain-containing protein n=1 Tax=Timema bartmani TaxID=61472 RepID=A0A7R9I4S9_9NEOP|nr:unnamed protein product [Timema bartmani]
MSVITSQKGVSEDKYDDGHDGYLDLGEMKRMMEKLGAPQTHLGLKSMIAEVDEDGDSKISFRELPCLRRPGAGFPGFAWICGRLGSTSSISSRHLVVVLAKCWNTRR